MMRLFNWHFLKKWVKRCTIVFGVIYVLGVIDKSLPRTPYCPVEKHSFKGQEFDLKLCLNLTDNSERIGIFVYSKNGSLLAWRGATFANESSLNYMAIEDTQILYSDDPMNQEDSPADCVLNMPPTWVDWIEARLPGGIPGVNHCGKASYSVIRKARDQWAIRTKAADIKEEARMREYNAKRLATPPPPLVVDQTEQPRR